MSALDNFIFTPAIKLEYRSKYLEKDSKQDIYTENGDKLLESLSKEEYNKLKELALVYQDPHAQFDYSVCLSSGFPEKSKTGFAGETNLKLAFELMENAEKQGLLMASWILGRYYQDAKLTKHLPHMTEVTRNAKTYELCLKAANGGFSQAQLVLARELGYTSSKSIFPKDLQPEERMKQSFQWYQKAAKELGEANFHLGLYYKNNKGVPIEQQDRKIRMELALQHIAHSIELGFCLEGSDPDALLNELTELTQNYSYIHLSNTFGKTRESKKTKRYSSKDFQPMEIAQPMGTEAPTTPSKPGENGNIMMEDDPEDSLPLLQVFAKKTNRKLYRTPNGKTSSNLSSSVVIPTVSSTSSSAKAKSSQVLSPALPKAPQTLSPAKTKSGSLSPEVLSPNKSQKQVTFNNTDSFCYFDKTASPNSISAVQTTSQGTLLSSPLNKASSTQSFESTSILVEPRSILKKPNNAISASNGVPVQTMSNGTHLSSPSSDPLSSPREQNPASGNTIATQIPPPPFLPSSPMAAQSKRSEPKTAIQELLKISSVDLSQFEATDYKIFEEPLAAQRDLHDKLTSLLQQQLLYAKKIEQTKFQAQLKVQMLREQISSGQALNKTLKSLSLESSKLVAMEDDTPSKSMEVTSQTPITPSSPATNGNHHSNNNSNSSSASNNPENEPAVRFSIAMKKNAQEQTSTATLLVEKSQELLKQQETEAQQLSEACNKITEQNRKKEEAASQVRVQNSLMRQILGHKRKHEETQVPGAQTAQEDEPASKRAKLG